MPLNPHLPSLLFSLLVAYRGHRSSSLSPSGALSAALLGWLALGNPLAVWGTCLLAFYGAGSKATKVKAAIKSTYEQAEHPTPSSTPSGKPAKAGGNRNAVQVAANSLVGVLCATVWRFLYSGELGDRAGWEEEGRWCVTEYAFGERRWSRTLVFVAVAFWAGCAGDTLASELGILSSSPPFLLSTLSSTPRGTNGAISAWGTFVSLLGGLFVGVVAVVALALQGQGAACGEGWEWAGELVVVGAAAGVGGSMVDSLLGFLFQPTFYSPSKRLVVHRPPSSTSSGASYDSADDTIVLPGTAVVGPWLSNNGVNVVSTLVVAGVAGWYSWL